MRNTSPPLPRVGAALLVGAVLLVGAGCDSGPALLDPPRLGIDRLAAPTDLTAADTPGDAGQSITLSWKTSPTENTPEFHLREAIARELAASDGSPAAEARIRAAIRGPYAAEPRIEYHVFQEETLPPPSTGTVWRLIATFPSGVNFEKLSDSPCDFRETGGERHYFAVKKLRDGKRHRFRVELVLGDQRVEARAREPVRPGVVEAVSRPNWFEPGKLPLLAGVAVLVGLTLFFLGRARRNPRMFIRKIDGLRAVDRAMQDAARAGRPVYYVMGIGAMSDLPTIASVSILERIARQAARHGLRLKVPCFDPVVMSVAQDVVRSAFAAEGKAEAHVPDDVFFVTQDQFSYAASVDGMLSRDRPSTTFLLGYFQAESLLLAEVGASIGSVQIAGTDVPAQLPFFVTTADYTLIGEELYAASAYLSREPLLLGSLRSQDVGKALLVGVILAGVVLASVFDVDWLQRLLAQ
ncbi:MAG: hypothetical protein JXQ29_00575 [Planctomycetes bacterium]|nr:hypothetical protein [Planctomycetota bacterium]